MSEQQRPEETSSTPDFTDPTAPPSQDWPPREWSPPGSTGADTGRGPSRPAARPLSAGVPPPPPPSSAPPSPPPPTNVYGTAGSHQGNNPYADASTWAPAGQQGYTYSPPPAYYGSAAPQTNVSATALTTVSAVGLFLCCGITLPALVLGIAAMVQQTTNPEQSRRLSRYGWITFAVVLGIAVAALVGLLGMRDA
ncbi:MAG: hypothetical protein Q4G67_09195 [Actinomycetia bacterium]|nr:hypothetical protein [Actinomycetes bacterium]